MAQQLDSSESTPLLTPDLLPSIMGQEGEQRDHGISLSPNPSNTIIEPSADLLTLSSSTSSDSSTMMQVDHEDESMPLLLAASENSAVEHQHEGREPNPHLNSPRVEHEMQPSSSDMMHAGTEQQHEHRSSLLRTSGEPNPNTQHSIGDRPASNIVTQQAEIKQQHQPFSLSGPLNSTIMLRRHLHAESASAARNSPPQTNLQNLNPRRVRQFISTLDCDEDLAEILCKLVIATAPFHNVEPQRTPSVPEESNQKATTLLQTLDGLVFSPKSSTAPTAEKGSVTGNANENPTGDLLFDANAADTLGSREIEPRSDSPPLLFSTAAVEESLDPNAEDPKHYTVAELVNTINENRIQVESVTENDWLIEDVRVGILNHLINNPPEDDPTTEGDRDEAVGTEEDITEQIKTKGDTAKSDHNVEGRSNKAVVTKGPPTKQAHAKGDPVESNLASKGRSNKTKATDEEAPKQAQAKEDTSKADRQRWEEQGPDGWLKRDDGTDMNEGELDDEFARWDAMVRKARQEKEAEKVVKGTTDASDNPMHLQSPDLGERFDSVAAQIETVGSAAGDSSDVASDTAKIPGGDAPGKAGESMSEQEPGPYSPSSVYSGPGKNPIFPLKFTQLI